MTRKRFVKLLMCSGYSRNQANQMAKVFVRSYGSYEEAYIAWCIGVTNTSDVFQNFVRAVNDLFISATAKLREAFEMIDAEFCYENRDWI